MMILKDSIEITVPLNTLYAWLQALDENFVKWSPYHEGFTKISGGFEVGDTIQFKEQVEGVEYDITGIIRLHEKTDQRFTLHFETLAGMGQIYFIGEATEIGCRFTHIEKFGKPDTFFGRIFNWLLFNIIAKKKANKTLILKDMQEDNRYLKQILETGIYPQRLPINAG